MEARVSEGPWRDRVWSLLNSPGAPSNSLERHLLHLVDGDHPQCPCCYRPLSQSHFLKHLSQHADRSTPGLKVHHYPLPTLVGVQAEAFKTCFLAPCSTVFFDARRGTGYGEQLRAHLLSHEEQALAACGFNRRLLAQDSAAGQTPLQGNQAFRPQPDPQLLQKVQEWIRPMHHEALAHLEKLLGHEAMVPASVDSPDAALLEQTPPESWTRRE